MSNKKKIPSFFGLKASILLQVQQEPYWGSYCTGDIREAMSEFFLELCNQK